MARQAPQTEDFWTLYFNFEAYNGESDDNAIETPEEPSLEDAERQSAEALNQPLPNPEQALFQQLFPGLEAFDDMTVPGAVPGVFDDVAFPGTIPEAFDDEVVPGAFPEAFDEMLVPGANPALDNMVVPGVSLQPPHNMMGPGANPSMNFMAPAVHMNSTGYAGLPMPLPAFSMAGNHSFSVAGNPSCGFGGQYQGLQSLSPLAAPMQYFGTAFNSPIVPSGSIPQGRYYQHMPYPVAPRQQPTPPPESWAQVPKEPLNSGSQRAHKDGAVPIARAQQASRHEFTEKERKRMAKEANNAAKRAKRDH